MKDFDSLTLLLWFDCFLEAGAKILEKKFVGLLGDLKTPKGHFAISLVKSNFNFVSSEYMKFKDWLNYISVIYVFCNLIDFLRLLGNLDSYVPFVLKEIETQPKRQYLLLHSLKEIISAQSSTPSGVKALGPYVPPIWTQLFNHCECNEEGKFKLFKFLPI